jgi:hypothetical protein
MGRSVSYHGTPILYLAGITFGEYVHNDDPDVERDEDGNPVCDYWDFDEFIDDLRNVVLERYPSFYSCSKWPGREDHALLENKHALLGVSEYCGLISVWIAPDNPDRPELADAWISSILRNLKAHLIARFRSFACVKMGTFSNGESVYSRITP